MSFKKADVVWVKGGPHPREAVVVAVSPASVEVRFVDNGRPATLDPARVSKERPKD